MSTSKLDTSGIFKPVTVRSDRTTLSLPQCAVCIRKSGIEFCSPTPIPAWTEMTVTLEYTGEAKRVNCTGIVVACDGNSHPGYEVSMLFMNLSRQSQVRLNLV